MSSASTQALRRITGVFSVLATAVLATALFAAAPASSAPAQVAAWAPADTAAIHPGVQMYTEGAQCTANFVYTDGAGNTYVGYAAHCAGTGAATDTNGCDAASLPLGTRVTFAEGGSLASEGTAVGHGTLAYSSWLTMQNRNESNEDACAYNDLALVKVDAADVAKVNPSLPFWGGPVGINTAGTAAGETVYSFGNSSLRGGVEELSPKQGASLGTDPSGWTHPVYTVTPGVPGDSGSAFLDAEGNALGTLSTLAIAPLVGSNGVGDLNSELELRPGERRDRRARPGAGHRALLADPLTLASTASSVAGRGCCSLGGHAAHPIPEVRRPARRPRACRLGLVSARAGSAAVEAAWAPAATAKIHPGVQMFTKGAQCTGNFVFSDDARRVVRRVRRSLCRPRCRDRHQWLPNHVTPARHPGPVRRGRDDRHRRHHRGSRHPRLQLVARDASARDIRSRRVRGERLRPGAGRRR